MLPSPSIRFPPFVNRTIASSVRNRNSAGPGMASMFAHEAPEGPVRAVYHVESESTKENEASGGPKVVTSRTRRLQSAILPIRQPAQDFALDAREDSNWSCGNGAVEMEP
eukprot:727888-Alexandrium_andersonii.AAC.1